MSEVINIIKVTMESALQYFSALKVQLKGSQPSNIPLLVFAGQNSRSCRAGGSPLVSPSSFSYTRFLMWKGKYPPVNIARSVGLPFLEDQGIPRPYGHMGKGGGGERGGWGARDRNICCPRERRGAGRDQPFFTKDVRNKPRDITSAQAATGVDP